MGDGGCKSWFILGGGSRESNAVLVVSLEHDSVGGAIAVDAAEDAVLPEALARCLPRDIGLEAGPDLALGPP